MATDNATLDRLDLKLLREKAEKATPGPWTIFNKNGTQEVGCAEKNAPICHWAGFDQSDRPKAQHLANIRFIVAARDALPALLDELTELRARLVAPPEAELDALTAALRKDVGRFDDELTDMAAAAIDTLRRERDRARQERDNEILANGEIGLRYGLVIKDISAANARIATIQRTLDWGHYDPWTALEEIKNALAAQPPETK